MPPTDLADWPGRDHREPPTGIPGWTIRRPLADWLRAEGARATGLRVLDVGCGVKPYYPYFASAASYVGVDVQENPSADVHGPVEALPLEDGSFDIVLCTQVLEHVDDPAAAVRELHRVTAPGGRVLASTHGVMVYHPNPVDLWRWTHTGLERLFEACAWSEVRVRPGAGSASCLAMLLGTYLHLLAKRAHAAALARPPIAALNRLATALDGRVALLRDPVPGALFANYHVVAVK
jgi:SAM-dependent methyltransferase